MMKPVDQKVIVPLADWVLLELLSSKTTEGGIHLPESASQEQGFVVRDVGNEVERVKKGDFVICINGRISKALLKGKDINMFLIPEEDIVAVIKSAKK